MNADDSQKNQTFLPLTPKEKLRSIKAHINNKLQYWITTNGKPAKERPRREKCLANLDAFQEMHDFIESLEESQNV